MKSARQLRDPRAIAQRQREAEENFVEERPKQIGHHCILDIGHGGLCCYAIVPSCTWKCDKRKPESRLPERITVDPADIDLTPEDEREWFPEREGQ